MDLYNAGIDLWGTWTTSVYKVLMVTSGSFDPDLATVSAILAAYCIDENIELEPLLKDLFSDIRNITDIHMKAINNRQIKVEI